MKVQDYYMKYKEYFEDAKDESEINNIITEIVKEMNQELFEITNKRQIKTDRAVLAVVKEMNQKWNALIRIFEKEKIQCFMKVDGFKSMWMNRLTNGGK